MAITKTEYNLLISCPGDVSSVVNLINAVVRKFNDTYSDVYAIRLNAKHWSNSSYNQSGGKAQALLNQQFIHDCDAAIAVFWTRFGTPTDKYGSGTEEEIEDMLDNGKQVFLYFCEKPIDPSLLLSEDAQLQYRKVKAYREKYEADKGISSTYTNDSQFKKLLFAHLSMHFLSLKRVGTLSNNRQPLLQIKGIYNGNVQDSFHTVKFCKDISVMNAEREEHIRSLYKKISSYSLDTKAYISPYEKFTLSLKRKVELDSEITTFIEMFAEARGIELGSDFFNLGNLQEDSVIIPNFMGGTHNIYGTDAEQEKYEAILELYWAINDILQETSFVSTYKDLYCIKLSLCNAGTAYDEDIDISLKIKKQDVFKFEQIPIPDEFGCKYASEKQNVSDLFGIPATQNYNSFGEYNQNDGYVEAVVTPSLHVSNSVETYISDLRDTFAYDFFEDGDYIIVRLHVGYLKHNTAVAFPSVLFVSKELLSIEYTIRSKHTETEITGIIKAGGNDET